MDHSELTKRLDAIRGLLLPIVPHPSRTFVEEAVSELQNLIDDLNDEQREVCTQCNTAIRPEGGHRCGDCGRDI